MFLKELLRRFDPLYGVKNFFFFEGEQQTYPMFLVETKRPVFLKKSDSLHT